MNIKRKIIPLSVVLLLAGLVSLQAGQQYSPEPAVCRVFGDYSGYCLGTFRGFRESPNAGDFAQFSNLGYSAAFLANFNGTAVNCAADPVSSPQAMEVMNKINTGRNYFYVAWNAAGVCTSVQSFQVSYYAGD